MSYDNELRGVLFKNNNQREGKKDADYRGSAVIAGVEYFLDAWVNESKAGAKYLAIKFKAKEPRPVQEEPAGVAAEEDPSDDLPF